ncbi:MAG: hypothetical protein LBQ52_04910 [Helicobacteraceae bacterium]|nr:hypothetical protein [Helicobacteraceae bacterium]
MKFKLKSESGKKRIYEVSDIGFVGVQDTSGGEKIAYAYEGALPLSKKYSFSPIPKRRISASGEMEVTDEQLLFMWSYLVLEKRKTEENQIEINNEKWRNQ